jgi:outer membrane receptor protein involved in Fe transport
LYGGLQLNFVTANDPCSSRSTVRTPEVEALCIATGVPAGTVFSAGIQPDNIIASRSGGNPNLEEESSDTRTFGVVLTPAFLPSLAVTIDYFDITLDDAIAQLGGGLQNTLNLCYLTVQDANSDFCRAISRNPATGSITVPYTADTLQANIGGLETSGVDLQARYGFDVAWGGFGGGGSRFDISSAWTYTDEFTVTPMQAVPDNTNECIGAYGGTCGEPIPEFKGVTRLTWTSGALGVSLRHRFIDSVMTDRVVLPQRRGATPPALDTLTNPKIDAFNYFDLSATYDFTDSIEIYGGINNILDKDPPIVVGQGGYGNTYPATYDYAGMTMFLGFSVNTF